MNRRRPSSTFDLNFAVICVQHGVSMATLIGHVAAAPCTCVADGALCLPCRCRSVVEEYGTRVDRVGELADKLHEVRP